MEKMKALYQKVAKSDMLQKKLNWIANDAEIVGEKKTNERLIYFAKDAGYDITIEEMHAFFKELSEQQNEELSEAELDMVAGGKSGFMITTSIITLGVSCGILSITRAIEKKDFCA